MNTLSDIKTEHCLLKHISEDDIIILKEIFEDNETKKYLPELYLLIDKNDGILDLILTFDLYTEKGEGYLWGIHREDKLLGFIAIMDLSSNPIMFYAMHPAYRSLGYMKNSISAIINFLKENKLSYKISTDVYKNNKISIHILQQLGFNIYKEDNKKVYMLKLLT